MRARAAGLALLLLGLCAGAARAQSQPGERFNLRAPARAGTTWSVHLEEEVNVEYPPDRRRRGVEKYRLVVNWIFEETILEVGPEGRPSAVRIAIGPGTGATAYSAVTKPDFRKAPLAGETVTVRRTAGAAAIEAKKAVDAGSRPFLSSRVNPIMADRPVHSVALAERWTADPQAYSADLARARALPASGTFEGVVRAVREVDGLRAAEVSCKSAMAFTDAMDSAFQVDGGGTILVDLASGTELEADFKGQLWLTPLNERTGTGTYSHRSRTRPKAGFPVLLILLGVGGLGVVGVGLVVVRKIARS